ncbi:MAG TPA: hypothetical protein VLN48_01410 [Bryobacteraceae bacterium]|nr:hypothetical protein [Bryobacteraceae bacterium]
MEYFALLTVATVIIAVLAAVLYRKRGDAGTLLGIGALYYWSLFGAWYIVIDKTGGFSGKHYQYLEGKLFPIVLDQNYLVTLGLYAGFVILVELTLLFTVAPVSKREPSPVLLRHAPILWIGLGAGLVSLALVYDKLSAAWALNVSAYVYTRAQTDEWFTLHQVLNRVALLPPAIGLAVLAAGKRPRVLVSVGRRYTLPSYVLLLGAMATFTFVLGNKNEILAALVAGVLAYIGTARRPKWIGVGLVLAAGFWFLYAIDLFRAVPLAGLREEVGGRVEEATGVARFLTSSNEAYGAHFSMYGVLSAGVEPRFGYSLYALASSVIPRVVWPDRPRDIYLYYSESVGAIQNQGYSLHHATGWYLNFGYLGVALGAIIMGLVWAYCLNAHRRTGAGPLFRLFATVAPWLFAACLAPLIRAGPEGYKGFLIEGVLIPVGVLAFSCRKKHVPAKLAWHPQRGWVCGAAR